MLDILQITRSIITTKLKLFAFVYAQAMALFILSISALLMFAPKSLLGYLVRQMQNISELGERDVDIGSLSYLFILLFLMLLSFVYLGIANIYVTIIKKELYNFKHQLQFILYNMVKVTILRIVLFFSCIVMCGMIFFIVGVITKSVMIAIIPSFLVLYFYFTPIFFIAEIELLMNRSSFIDSLRAGILFTRYNFNDCVKIFSLILMLQMIMNMTPSSVVYIVLYCVLSIFTTVLVTVFYLKNKNNLLNIENLA